MESHEHPISECDLQCAQTCSHVYAFITILEEAIEKKYNSFLLVADSLYTYQVPLLGEGGACSLFGKLDPTPYSLAASLGGPSASVSLLLAKLNALVETALELSKADWVC